MANAIRDAFDEVILKCLKFEKVSPETLSRAELRKWYEEICWFFSDEVSHLYSFASICQWLNLPKSRIRGQLAYFMKNPQEYEETQAKFRGV